MNIFDWAHSKKITLPTFDFSLSDVLSKDYQDQLLPENLPNLTVATPPPSPFLPEPC